MACYVIVTCMSMLWTTMTLITALAVFYCLSSTEWLVGFQRHPNYHETLQEVNQVNQSIEEKEYIFYRNLIDKESTSKYSPTIGKPSLVLFKSFHLNIFTKFS